MKKTTTLLIGMLALALCSCDQRYPKTQPSKHKVHCYRAFDTSSNDWLYYYVIFDNSINRYYYTSSPTSSAPLTDFRSTNWTVNTTKPAQLDQENTEELEYVDELETAELGENFEAVEDGAYTEVESEMDAAEAAEDSSVDSSDTGSDFGDSGGDSGGGGGE
jgi:hypothetical protein